MSSRTIFLALAGASLIALAGCSDDAQQSAETTRERAERAGEDAAERAGDAASDLAGQASRLAEDARRRAEQALEDAGPALDRAGEIAGQIGASVTEIVERGRADIERAARALEQAVSEATSGNGPLAPVGDASARLGPEAGLNADTRAAARAAASDVGADYVGAWAVNAESCALIDREPMELFAVVTPTTIRRHESVCNIEPGETVDGQTTVSASCFVEGEQEERQLVLDTSEPGTLRITQGDQPGTALVACSLPEGS